MTDGMHLPPNDFDRALLVPSSVFASPREVVENSALTAQQKIEVLYRWAYDAAELAVALEEGMPNGDDDLQRSILLALEDLQARIDTERAGPTKHHGLAG